MKMVLALMLMWSFWGQDRRLAYFNVKASPFCLHLYLFPIGSVLATVELSLIRKGSSDERIREVERGTFSPLIFSSSGVMDPTATVVFKRIANF